jgi:hypothetical protein
MDLELFDVSLLGRGARQTFESYDHLVLLVSIRQVSLEHGRS